MCNMCINLYFPNLSEKSTYSNKKCIWFRAMADVLNIPENDQKKHPKEPYLRIVWDNESKANSHPIEQQYLLPGTIFNPISNVPQNIHHYNTTPMPHQFYITPNQVQFMGLPQGTVPGPINPESGVEPSNIYQSPVSNTNMTVANNSVGCSSQYQEQTVQQQDISNDLKNVFIMSQNPFIGIVWNEDKLRFDDYKIQSPSIREEDQNKQTSTEETEKNVESISDHTDEAVTESSNEAGNSVDQSTVKSTDAVQNNKSSLIPKKKSASKYNRAVLAPRFNKIRLSENSESSGANEKLKVEDWPQLGARKFSRNDALTNLDNHPQDYCNRTESKLKISKQSQFKRKNKRLSRHNVSKSGSKENESDTSEIPKELITHSGKDEGAEKKDNSKETKDNTVNCSKTVSNVNKDEYMRGCGFSKSRSKPDLSAKDIEDIKRVYKLPLNSDFNRHESSNPIAKSLDCLSPIKSTNSEIHLMKSTEKIIDNSSPNFSDSRLQYVYAEKCKSLPELAVDAKEEKKICKNKDSSIKSESLDKLNKEGNSATVAKNNILVNSEETVPEKIYPKNSNPERLGGEELEQRWQNTRKTYSRKNVKKASTSVNIQHQAEQDVEILSSGSDSSQRSADKTDSKGKDAKSSKDSRETKEKLQREPDNQFKSTKPSKELKPGNHSDSYKLNRERKSKNESTAEDSENIHQRNKSKGIKPDQKLVSDVIKKFRDKCRSSSVAVECVNSESVQPKFPPTGRSSLPQHRNELELKTKKPSESGDSDSKPCAVRFNTDCKWEGDLASMITHAKKCHPSLFYISNNQKMFILQFWKKPDKKYYALFSVFNNIFRFSYHVDAENGKVTFGTYFLKEVPNYGDYCYEIVILRKLTKLVRLKAPCFYMTDDRETFMKDSYISVPYDVLINCTDHSDNQGHLYFIVKIYKN